MGLSIHVPVSAREVSVSQDRKLKVHGCTPDLSLVDKRDRVRDRAREGDETLSSNERPGQFLLLRVSQVISLLMDHAVIEVAWLPNKELYK